MKEDSFLNVTKWLAEKCRESMSFGNGCLYRKMGIGNGCPIKAKCGDVTPEDWKKALLEGQRHSVPESQSKLSRHKKIMFCKLVDKNKVEVCTGALIDTDANLNFDNFDFFEKCCRTYLIKSFRNRLAEKLPSCANKTDEQIKDLIDALIAIEGYNLEWGYCGWEKK